MTTTLPRPSNTPPSTALPAIPVVKPRRTAASTPLTVRKVSSASKSFTKSGLRAPSATGSRSSSDALVPRIPRDISPMPGGMNTAGKTLRKTISINSFPQPPNSSTRRSSLPPGSLYGAITSNARSPRTFADGADSADSFSPANTTINAPKPALKRKISNIGTPRTDSQNEKQRPSPSILHGHDDEDVPSSGAGARSASGLLGLPSPPPSRHSSARDSDSSATNHDDDTNRGRQTSVVSSTADRRVSKAEGRGNVLVSVRVRPDAGKDDENADGEWMVDGRRNLIAYRGKESGDYFYDNVFATHDNNARVYDSCAKRLVRRVMEGYHGTVFAYGMTGTGKTFSMQGTATSPGVIPLAITDIFSYIRETPSREFLLRVSYLEIYNEKIHDLLSEAPTGNGGVHQPQQEEIKLREDAKRGVYATPLKEEIVQSPTQLLRVIARGDHARRTSSTQFNARSSRSHAVVQIVVESRERLPGLGAAIEKRQGILPGGVRVSTLSLIDLAGSERAAETKERRTEGSHINKSLLTLGTVIAKLSESKDKDGKLIDKDGKHLPYRDSKLTRLLQGALSGGSLVSILCTVQIGSMGSTAAANTHVNETLNTLKFASRAKNNIVSHAKKADEGLGAGGEGGARVLLERYRLEIQELRAQIDNQNKVKEGDPEKEKKLEQEAETRHEEQMLEMQLARTALKERIEHLNRLILSSKSIGVNGSVSSLGMHPRLSSMTSNSQLYPGVSSRISLARSETSTSRGSLHRSPSLQSTTSTIARIPTPKRLSDGDRSIDEEESFGEYGDGNASLTAQNRALQSDLADKTRYIATLEKRLLQARRSSNSRSGKHGVSHEREKSGGLKTLIMVGEDHGVSSLLKEKDLEIAELRARLGEKDRMLSALSSASRNHDLAAQLNNARQSVVLMDSMGSMGVPSPISPVECTLNMEQSSPATVVGLNGRKGRSRNVDEMSRMLDEMIQDRVEHASLAKGQRGPTRLPRESLLINGVAMMGAVGARTAEGGIGYPSTVSATTGEGVEV